MSSRADSLESLTDWQLLVLQAIRELSTDLDDNDGLTPGDIGMGAGVDYDSASSRACSALKALVERGFVEKKARGRYRLTKLGWCARG